jgi:hypothetical protein
MAPNSEEWFAIAEQASKEMDSKKLSVLIEELCGALDDRDRRRREMYGSAMVVKLPLPTNPSSSISCR